MSSIELMSTKSQDRNGTDEKSHIKLSNRWLELPLLFGPYVKCSFQRCWHFSFVCLLNLLWIYVCTPPLSWFVFYWIFYFSLTSSLHTQVLLNIESLFWFWIRVCLNSFFLSFYFCAVCFAFDSFLFRFPVLNSRF